MHNLSHSRQSNIAMLDAKYHINEACKQQEKYNMSLTTEGPLVIDDTAARLARDHLEAARAKIEIAIVDTSKNAIDSTPVPIPTEKIEPQKELENQKLQREAQKLQEELEEKRAQLNDLEEEI